MKAMNTEMTRQQRGAALAAFAAASGLAMTLVLVWTVCCYR